MRTTEYVVEAVDEHGDIDGEYFPTMQAAVAYATMLRAAIDAPPRVRIARVTNHWDRNDRDNLLSRDYDYLTL